jgi:hypothetical protein
MIQVVNRNLPAFRSHLTCALIFLVPSFFADARSGPIPAEDEWTENDIASFWVPEPLSKGRISAEQNTGQLIGALAAAVRITADGKPATISLRMDRTWDLSTTDRLVFAWRSETADFVESQPLTITVWAKNEIGEGRSVYKISETPGPKWSHVRLDLGEPIETDSILWRRRFSGRVSPRFYCCLRRH